MTAFPAPGMGELVHTAVEFGEARYVLERLLDAGGMGEVYLATRVISQGAMEWRTSERVAIKVVRRDLAAEFGGNLQPFLDEARLHLCLDHPNIVHAHGVTAQDDTLYLVMEYLEGRDLRSLLRLARAQGKQLSEATVCAILAQVADALDYVHRATDQGGRPLNIVHRDLSPSNVYITASGEVKLLDFGVAFSTLEGRLRTGSSENVYQGKLKYLSPEQANHQKLDGRSDLFALGCILAEARTGRNPFEAPSEALIVNAIRNVTPAFVEAALQGTSEGLKAICHQLLARNPSERYGSGKQVAEALRAYTLEQRYLIHSAAVAKEVAALERSPPPPPPSEPHREVKARGFLAFVAGAALILAAIAYFQPSQPPPQPAVVEWTPMPAPIQEAPVIGEEKLPAPPDPPKKKTGMVAKAACAAGALAAACQVHVPTRTQTGNCSIEPPVREVSGHKLPDELSVFFVSLNGEKCKPPPFLGTVPTEPWVEPCPAGEGTLVVMPINKPWADEPPPVDFLQGALLYGQAHLVDDVRVVDAVGERPREGIKRMRARFTELRLKDGTKLPICGVLFDGNYEEDQQAREGLPVVLDPKDFNGAAVPTLIPRVRLYWP